MKKNCLSVHLLMIFVLNTLLPCTTYAAELVVSRNKPIVCLTSGLKAGYLPDDTTFMPDKIVDGDKSTQYIGCFGNNAEDWFTLDLEKEYPISHVEIDYEHQVDSEVAVVATNKPLGRYTELVDGEYIRLNLSEISGPKRGNWGEYTRYTADYTMPDGLAIQNYRYIRFIVNRKQVGGNNGFRFYEASVYANAEGDENPALISTGKLVTNDSDETEHLTDKDMTTTYHINDIGKTLTLDLEDKLSINSVCVNYGSKSSASGELMLSCADGQPDDYVVLSRKTIGNSEVYTLPEEAEGKKYRYIHYVASEYNTDDGTEIAEIEVYSRNAVISADIYGKLIPGETVSLKASYLYETACPVQLVFSLYENGRLIHTAATEKIILQGIDEFHKDYRIPKNVSGQNTELCVYMWESFESLKPICRASVIEETTPHYQEYYVSANGSDNNDGYSENTAFKTVKRAQEVIRGISADMNGDIIVNILADGGIHYLEEPLWFHAEDSGQNGYNIIYRGIEDENGDLPILSGGIELGEFVPSSTNEKLWETTVTDDRLVYIRQLYVNGRMADAARSNTEILSDGLYYETGSKYRSDGLYVSKKRMDCYENPQDVELHWARQWVHNIAPVENIVEDPENSERLIVKMEQGYWDANGNENEDSLSAHPDYPFFVVNAMELLDSPGEFYFNRVTKKLYYYPREDEDMRSAKVIAPLQDKILQLKGNDIDDKIHNISFEHLQLAHTSFNGPSEGGYRIIGQATAGGRTIGVNAYRDGAISLNMAENIEFCGNYFFGLGEAGIDMENACENITVEGNAFSDIGSAAVVVGRPAHADSETGDVSEFVPSDALDKLSLIHGNQKTWASYHWPDYTYADSNEETCHIDLLAAGSARNYVTQATLTSRVTGSAGTWMSSKEDAANGKKAWVKWDFGEPYNVDSVTLKFSSDVVKSAQRSNFEILLSNDKEFLEGNYVTAAVQNGSANVVSTYNLTEPGKYRYMMVRTLGPTVLQLTKAIALTSDRKPYTRYERCKNINISNNYLKRISAGVLDSCAMVAYYVENTEFLHNEISDVPYSGISMGWGWGDETGSRNNRISHNYVENTSRTLFDGGSYYVLGPQPGTEITDNWAKSDVIGSAAYYLDEGTNGLTYRNNVSTDCRTIAMGCLERGENILTDFYADHTSFGNFVNTTVWNKPTQILEANPDAKAWSIMENAGLESRFEYLRDLVEEREPLRLPQDEYNMRHAIGFGLHTGLKQSLQIAANDILTNGSFGDLPGQYPVKYRYEISKALEEMDNGSGDSSDLAFMRLREIIEKATNSFNRISLQNLMSRAQKLLNSGEGSDELAEKLTQITVEIDSGVSQSREYSLLVELEKAYREAIQNCAEEIIYVYTDEMISCDIDNASREIRLQFPYGVDLTKEHTLTVELSSGERRTERCSLNDNAPITVSNETWTIISERENYSMEQWLNSSSSTDDASSENGLCILAPSYEAYINTLPMKSGEKRTVSVKNAGVTYNTSISFILGAETAKDFTYGSIKNEYFEFEIDEKNAMLSYVSGGEKTVIADDIVLPKAITDESIPFTFCMTGEANGVRIEIWQSGSQVVNCLSETGIADGFMGIHTEYTKIRLNKSDLVSVKKPIVSRVHGEGGFMSETGTLTYTIDKANDGDASTCFIGFANASAPVEWITMDLEEAYVIDRIHLNTWDGPQYNNGTYEVIVTNQPITRYTELEEGEYVVLEKRDDGYYLPDNVTRRDYRYARVNYTRPNYGDAFRLFEFSVYGETLN